MTEDREQMTEDREQMIEGRQLGTEDGREVNSEFEMGNVEIK